MNNKTTNSELAQQMAQTCQESIENQAPISASQEAARLAKAAVLGALLIGGLGQMMGWGGGTGQR